MHIKVAALMPTIKLHAKFRPTAEACFYQQWYPTDWQVELLVDDHETDSLGKKLNRLCSACVVKGIDYVVLWDDDDWYNRLRLATQLAPLLPIYDGRDRSGCDVSGTSTVYYHNGKEGWLYKGDPAVWLYGLAFKISVWQKHPFEDASKGVDTRWLKNNIAPAARYDINDPALSIATIHSTNTCAKHTAGKNWSRVDYQKLQDIMKEQTCQQ